MHVAVNSRSRSESLVLCVCARSHDRHVSLLLFDGPDVRLPSDVLYKPLERNAVMFSRIIAFCP